MKPEQNIHPDRRHSDRFAIERQVSYRVLSKRNGDETGEGKTVNVSSSGVLFTAGHFLPAGRRMEVSISWPAKLNSRCALRLVASGRVVRREGDRIAVEIHRYQFRTEPSERAG